MLTLNTPHFYSLIIAYFITFIVLVTIWGFSKTKISYLLLLVFLPFGLCAFSIFVPFLIIQKVIYLFYIFGFLLGLKKVILFKWKLLLNDLISNFKSCQKWERYTIFFIFLHILSTLIASTAFTGLGTILDAMTYHLGSPKEWALYLKGPHLNTNNPVTLVASYFEYIQYSIFVIAKPLYEFLVPFKNTHHEFLSYTLLLSGQILTGFFGTILIPFLIFNIFKKHKYFFYIIILFIFSLKNLTWTWVTAKNDSYPLYCSLVAYYYFILNKKKASKYKTIFISFLILAIGLGAKLTNIHTMLAILGYMFIKHFKTIYKFSENNKYLYKFILIALSGGIIGLLPFLLRNFYETTNPFFPTTFSYFPNIYLSDITDKVHKLYSDPTTWHYTYVKLVGLFIGNKGLLLMCITSLLLKKWKEPFYFILLSIIISKITGQRFMWRQISMIIFFLLIWGEDLWKYYIQLKFKNKKVFSYSIITLLVISSQFKPERFFKYPIRYYFKTTGSNMKEQYYQWDLQVQENIMYRNDKNYIAKYTSYFSRFPLVNFLDSRKEYRDNYQRTKN